VSESLGSAVLDLDVDASGMNRGLAQAEGNYRDANGRLRNANGKFVKDTESSMERGTRAVGGFARNAGGQMDSFSSRAKAGFKRVGGAARKAGRAMTLGFALPMAFAAHAAGKELVDIQAANAGSAASVKRLGSHTKLTVKKLQDMAVALQNVSGQDDQLIQTGANLMARLSGINTETDAGVRVFKKASLGMVDLATVMKTDAPAAAKLLSKSLAAAAGGTVALPRGLKLTAKETTRLEKAMKATHDPTKRQALLMDALHKKIGGAAKAAGGTDAAKFGVLMDNLKGIGASLLVTLLPALRQGADWLKRMADKFQNLSPHMKKMVAIALAVAVAMGPLASVIGAVVAVVEALVAVVGLIISPVGLVVVGIAALIVVMVVLYRKSETVRTIINGLWELLKVSPLGQLVRWIGRVVQGMGGWARVFKVAELAFLTQIRSMMSGLKRLVDFMGKLPGSMGAPFRAVSKSMGRDISALDVKINDVKASLREVGPTAKRTMPAFVAAIAPAMKAASSFAASIQIAKSAWDNWNPKKKKLNIQTVMLPNSDKFTPKLPGLATGGDVAGAGRVLVGEKGPEFLDLPRGARVTPLDKAGGGDTYTINVDARGAAPGVGREVGRAVERAMERGRASRVTRGVKVRTA